MRLLSPTAEKVLCYMVDENGMDLLDVPTHTFASLMLKRYVQLVGRKRDKVKITSAGRAALGAHLSMMDTNWYDVLADAKHVKDKRRAA